MKTIKLELSGGPWPPGEAMNSCLALIPSEEWPSVWVGVERLGPPNSGLPEWVLSLTQDAVDEFATPTHWIETPPDLGEVASEASVKERP